MISSSWTRPVGVLSVVLAASVVVSAQPDVRLVTAVADQNLVAVETLLDEGVNVNTARADGATALLWAAHWDDVDTARRLLQAGALPDTADDHGVTPLHRAAENASLTMTETLLAAGANPNAAQASGLTPLMVAARTGSDAVVTALVAAGANVNAVTNETQSTALMWAVSEQHPELVHLLLDSGADPHASEANGYTAMLYAAHNGDIAIAETLLAAGVGVNETGVDGTHPLAYAIAKGHDQFALFLLGRGADPNAEMGGVHALHLAAGTTRVWLLEWSRSHGLGDGYLGGGFRGEMRLEQRLPVVQALLEHGAEPNIRITASAMFQTYIGYPKRGAFETFSCGTGDVRGATPLWIAAYGANGSRGGYGGSTSTADIIRALLAAGADQHLTTDDGTTPFMAAAGLGRCTFRPREPRGIPSPSAVEAVQVLLDAGAEINAVNEADFTALHGAAMRGLNEVIEFLVAQGADINARDFRGRTPYRLAEGSKQSFQFQSWPETAALLEQLGADTRLGIPGTVQERLRDVVATDNQD